LNSDTCVWITGTAGLLGHNLLRFAPPVRTVGLNRETIELTDFAAVEGRFRQDRPTLVIHCAAMSRTPDCQANPALARKINVDVTRHLAGLAGNVDFIFFSSDQVFDGRKGNYIESDAPNPLGVYGETKLVAEEIVAKNPRHTIVRLNLCGGASAKGGTAFNEELQRAWREGKTMRFFYDEFRSPLAAPVAARAVWELAAKAAPGIFHLGGSKRLSRLEIGQLVAARHPELSPRFEGRSLRDYQGAPRSPDCSVCCDKIQRLLSFPLPGLSEWLTANPQEAF